jgi:hypothetical protein
VAFKLNSFFFYNDLAWISLQGKGFAGEADKVYFYQAVKNIF